MTQKRMRNSSKFTFYIGYILVAAAVVSVILGFLTGAVNSTNIVELVWALLLSAAAFLGINLSRVAVENVTTIKSAADVSVSSDYMPESTTLSTPSGEVQIDQMSPSKTQADLPVGDVYNEDAHR